MVGAPRPAFKCKHMFIYSDSTVFTVQYFVIRQQCVYFLLLHVVSTHLLPIACGASGAHRAANSVFQLQGLRCGQPAACFTHRPLFRCRMINSGRPLICAHPSPALREGVVPGAARWATGAFAGVFLQALCLRLSRQAIVQQKEAHASRKHR